jgi:hypothetical protein
MFFLPVFSMACHLSELSRHLMRCSAKLSAFASGVGALQKPTSRSISLRRTFELFLFDHDCVEESTPIKAGFAWSEQWSMTGCAGPEAILLRDPTGLSRCLWSPALWPAFARPSSKGPSTLERAERSARPIGTSSVTART